jgi:hypothetical protein
MFRKTAFASHAYLDDAGVAPVQVGSQAGNIQAHSSADGNDGLLTPVAHAPTGTGAWGVTDVSTWHCKLELPNSSPYATMQLEQRKLLTRAADGFAVLLALSASDNANRTANPSAALVVALQKHVHIPTC